MECVFKLFQLPSAQQRLTLLPFCLLRGLRGGIRPNYLYWSRETGEYKTGLFRFLSSYLLSFHSPLWLQKPRILKKTTTGIFFYEKGTILTISLCSNLLFTFRLLWLNLPPCCSSFTISDRKEKQDWLHFCLPSTDALLAQHTNHCGGGKDTPLGPTLS